jgi:hypothetical protein
MGIFWWVYSKIDNYFFMRKVVREVSTAAITCLALEVMTKTINDVAHPLPTKEK